MRRLVTSFAAFGLFCAALGCTHTHGICDCDQDNNWCNPYAVGGCSAAPAHVPPAPLPPVPPPTVKPEPIKEMPKPKTEEEEQ